MKKLSDKYILIFNHQNVQIIYSLEKERDLKVIEISHIREVQESKEEELKINNLQLIDSNKKILETERKLCEQQVTIILYKYKLLFK